MHIDLIKAYEEIKEEVGSSFAVDGIGKGFYRLKSKGSQLHLPKKLGIEAKVRAIVNVKPEEPVTPENIAVALNRLISHRNALKKAGYEGEFKFLSKEVLLKQLSTGEFDIPDWGVFYDYNIPAKDVSAVKNIVQAFNETQRW